MIRAFFHAVFTFVFICFGTLLIIVAAIWMGLRMRGPSDSDLCVPGASDRAEKRDTPPARVYDVPARRVEPTDEADRALEQLLTENDESLERAENSIEKSRDPRTREMLKDVQDDLERARERMELVRLTRHTDAARKELKQRTEQARRELRDAETKLRQLEKDLEVKRRQLEIKD